MTQSKQSENGTAEQREFFRINQDVLFDYKVVDSFTAQDQAAEEAAEDILGSNPATELRKIDRELQQALQALSRKDSLVAEALSKLNRKVDKILQHSAFSGDSAGQNKSRINLSEGGIAFKSSRALYRGNYLLLRLVFLPGYLPVVIFAKVVRCESKDDEHQVAARFHEISAQTQQELARQIMKAQAAKRRKETGDKAS